MYYDKEDETPGMRTIGLKESNLDTMRQLLHQLLAYLNDFNRIITEDDGDGAAEPSAAHLVKQAREILRSRRRRGKFFNPSMFGEPAWDMLLILYAGMTDGRPISVGGLSSLSGAAPTTALRWLDYLEMDRLVAREPNPADRRSDFVDLTDKGRAAMEQYLSETLESGE